MWKTEMIEISAILIIIKFSALLAIENPPKSLHFKKKYK
jgi:hypothetical protein